MAAMSKLFKQLLCVNVFLYNSITMLDSIDGVVNYRLPQLVLYMVIINCFGNPWNNTTYPTNSSSLSIQVPPHIRTTSSLLISSTSASATRPTHLRQCT